MKSFWSHGLLLILGLGIGYVIGDTDSPSNSIEPTVAMAPADPMPEDASCSLNQGEEKTAVAKSSKASEKVASSVEPISSAPDEKSSEEVSQDDLVSEFWKVARKNPRRAEEIVRELGQRFPDSKVWHELRTHKSLLAKDYDNTRPLVKECLKKFPKSKQCLTANIHVESSIGTREQHGEAAKRCLELYPKHPNCYHELARYHMQAGRFDVAADMYKDLIENNGNYGSRMMYPHLYYQLGVALDGNMQKSEALTAFDKACQMDYEFACNRIENMQKSL